MKLRIADGLSLPADAVTQTFGILAKRGMGKTYTAAVLVEELLKAGSRVVVADPIGVWYGLRAAANGREPGLPIVVMGGDHGDMVLPADAGKAVADFVVDSDQSVVLDLSLFRKGEQVRFMTDFAETLYHRNRAPLHLVLDEADAFAPQRPQKGEERMLGAVEDLVRRGRARGIGVTLVTQRAAVLNKNVLTQVEVLVALRTIAPQDRDAMDAWIQAHGTAEERKTFMDSLASLGVGDAWFWSPGWLDIFKRVHVRKRETFDSSATPKAGEAKRAPKKLADVDLEQLKKTFSASIEKAKADDPRELRKRISALERELEGSKKILPRVERVEVPVPVLTGQDRELLAGLQRSIRDTIDAAFERVDGPWLPPGQARREISKAVVAAVKGGQDAVPVSSRRPIERAAKTSNGNGSLGNTGARRMLTALAQNPGGLTVRKLSLLTGLAQRGGTWRTYLGQLRSQGYVENAGDGLRITDAGVGALGSYEPLPTGMALIAYWRDRLGDSGMRRIFDVLVDVYPRALQVVEVATRTSMQIEGGTWRTYLGKLRTLELVEGRGELRASEELFG